MRTLKIVYIFLFIVGTVEARPKKLEVWFLSVSKTAFLDSILSGVEYSQSIAENRYACTRMGDYCFDPQIGLYKRDKNNNIHRVRDYSGLDTKEKFNKNGEYIEGKYDPCEKPGHFNIFCKNKQINKKKIQKKSLQKLEIWVDISSTMRQIDYNGEKSCYRENFLKRIHKSCPLNKKMKVYIFDENRKELGNFNRVCLNSGLNRLDRLMRDIKASQVENLIIITDIYEAKSEFIDFVEANGVGIVKGIDKPL